MTTRTTSSSSPSRSPHKRRKLDLEPVVELLIKRRKSNSRSEGAVDNPRRSASLDKDGNDSDEEEEGDDHTPVSRQTFLNNERLRRQREARNFVFDGDENAPKLTRSGRVVVTRDEQQDEPMPEDDGADAADEVDRVLRELPVEVQLAPTTPQKQTKVAGKQSAKRALPHGARVGLLQIMSTLTGRADLPRPPPFTDEDSNETLRGLVNLLQGTVERGEGNSALIVGPRGSGKSRTMARALDLMPKNVKTSPIIVRLSGLVQTNDRLAIRELGGQIIEAEGGVATMDEEDDEALQDEEYAPTTLPSHLLALLTTPSPRAIIIVMEEFHLFTEHARQALLYCLLDVVQSVKTGSVQHTGRGVAVIGITSRTDTLLLLEKRVKSRFSHRVMRVTSPLSSDGIGWAALLRRALIPWIDDKIAPSKETKAWQGDWEFAVDMLLKQEKLIRYINRLTGLSTDVRNLYRPFIPIVAKIINGSAAFVSVPAVTSAILTQVDGAGWGVGTDKLKGLSQPALVVLVIAKHLQYAGKEEFNFAQVCEEYIRFSRTRLVGSGRGRWPLGVLRMAYDQLLAISLFTPINSSLRPQFARVRCTLGPHEIVAWFKGDGAGSLGPEMSSWGRTAGGHA